MSKIIFLDVDGTLIDYEAKLPASAAQAVIPNPWIYFFKS